MLEIKDKIVEMYQNGKAISQIAITLGSTAHKVDKYITEAGVKKSRSEVKRKQQQYVVWDDDKVKWLTQSFDLKKYESLIKENNDKSTTGKVLEYLTEIANNFSKKYQSINTFTIRQKMINLGLISTTRITPTQKLLSVDKKLDKANTIIFTQEEIDGLGDRWFKLAMDIKINGKTIQVLNNNKFKYVNDECYADLKASCTKPNKIGGEPRCKWNITQKELDDIAIATEGKCYFTGEPLIFGKNGNRTASLDIIDNSRKEYIKDNVRFVHKMLNSMRGSYNTEDFIIKCVEVAKNHKINN